MASQLLPTFREAMDHDLPAVRALIHAALLESYRDAGDAVPAALPVDMQAELDDLPGRYGRPDGSLVVAVTAGAVVGCVGVRRHHDAAAVINRLYVRPELRRQGVGRQLAAAAVTRATELGYDRLLLDVIPARGHVVALYRGIGFVETEPFVAYPFEMVFLERRL